MSKYLQRIKAALAKHHNVPDSWMTTHRPTDMLIPWVSYAVPYEYRHAPPDSTIVIEATCWYCQRTEEFDARLGRLGLLTSSFDVTRMAFLRNHLHGGQMPPEYMQQLDAMLDPNNVQGE